MTSVGKSFSEVKNYVNKVEGVRRDSEAKALAKTAKISDNFQGSKRPILAAKPV